jgi:NTP pyrophosphatase (non-canonical NTP hydrolase)
MNNITHPQLVAALVKPGEIIKQELTPTDAHLWHMATGVAGEAGELLDAIKKIVIYRKPADLPNIKEELGDLEFFLEGVRRVFGITREETLQGNIEKLRKRYDSLQYSNQAAQERKDKQ